MNFGPHTVDVEEVVNFLRSGRLLAGSNPPNRNDIKVLRVIEGAKSFAETPPEAPDGVWSWRTIKTTLGTGDERIWNAVMDVQGPELSAKLSELWDEMYYVLKEQLGKKCSERDIQEILGDHEEIGEFRAAFGRANPFLENLFDLYRTGGYPCGWEGAYPDGRIVVFYPLSE